jgi:hypothetical protein
MNPCTENSRGEVVAVEIAGSNYTIPPTHRSDLEAGTLSVSIVNGAAFVAPPPDESPDLPPAG